MGFGPDRAGPVRTQTGPGPVQSVKQAVYPILNDLNQNEGEIENGIKEIRPSKR